MAPGGEAIPDIGLGNQNHCTRGYRTAAHQKQSCEIPGTQEGDYQKGNKENRCGTEVIHETEANDNGEGQDHKESQVSAAEQTVKRCRAGKNIAEFCKFRRLEAEAADANPVGCTMAEGTQQKRKQHTAERQCGHHPT